MKLYHEATLLGTIETHCDLCVEDAIILLNVDLDDYSIEGLHLEEDDYVETAEDEFNAFLGL
jgi:hypothetical protein